MIDMWIGQDAREQQAYDVCEHSLRTRTQADMQVRPIGQPAGLYMRQWRMDSAGRRVDVRDGRPFATDFAFSRFLVPALMGYQGWALYCDCDFLFQADVADLWALRDARYAVQCVQHRHIPTSPTKMDGQPQSAYPRKNWSSLILWNCAHPAHRALTPEAVNTQPGRWLHGFAWLPDDAIGALPEAWNWLSGWSSTTVEPFAIHYTGGGPWFGACLTVPLAERWIAEADRMKRAAAKRLAADLPHATEVEPDALFP